MSELRLAATPEQAEMITSPAKIKVAVCGRRWGKTVTAALYLASNGVNSPGGQSMYVAQSYARSLRQMRMMRASAGFMSFVRHTYCQFPPRFELFNGHEISFRTYDRPDKLVGEGMTLICFDEASRASEDLYYHVLLPMVADTAGTLFVTSTYNGRNWYYELGEKCDGVTSRRWTYPTTTACWAQDAAGKARLELLRAQFPPAVWAQEFLCEPLSTSNTVFRFVDKIVAPMAEVVTRARPGRHYIMGLDTAKVEDHTAWVVLECETGRVVYAEQLPIGTLWDNQIHRVAEIADRYSTFEAPCSVVMDTTGNSQGRDTKERDIILDKFSRKIKNVHSFTWSKYNKEQIIRHLSLEIEHSGTTAEKVLTIPASAEELIAQLKMYCYKILPVSQYCIYGPPGGTGKHEHDDYVSALAQAVWGRYRRIGIQNANLLPLSTLFR